jgi:benzoate-CoA ligase
MFIRRNKKYYYQGRSNDMMKFGGIWVSPIEVEAKIIEHPDVIEAGVVSSSNSSGIHKPKAYVVLTEDAKPSIHLKNEIKRMCMTDLPKNHYPQWIEFVKELPKTATGKIQRFQLRVWEAFSLNED